MSACGSGYPLPSNPAAGIPGALVRSPSDKTDLVHHYDPEVVAGLLKTPSHQRAPPMNSPIIVKGITIEDLTPTVGKSTGGTDESGEGRWQVSQDSLGNSAYKSTGRTMMTGEDIVPCSLDFRELSPEKGSPLPLFDKGCDADGDKDPEEGDDPESPHSKKRKVSHYEFTTPKRNSGSMKRGMASTCAPKKGFNMTMLDYFLKSQPLPDRQVGAEEDSDLI